MAEHAIRGKAHLQAVGFYVGDDGLRAAVEEEGLRRLALVAGSC